MPKLHPTRITLWLSTVIILASPLPVLLVPAEYQHNFTMLHDLALGALTFCLLLRLASSKTMGAVDTAASLLAIAAACLTAGDLGFGLALDGSIRQRPILATTSVLLYAAFNLLAVAALAVRWRRAEPKGEMWTFISWLGGFAALSMLHLLYIWRPLLAGDQLSRGLVIGYGVYCVSSSLLAALVFALSFRAMGWAELLFIYSTALPQISAFAYGHQVDRTQNYSGLPPMWWVWTISLCLMLLSIIMSMPSKLLFNSAVPRLAPWRSVRAGSNMIVFAASIAISISLVLFGIVNIRNGTHLSNIILAVFSGWVVSGFVALFVSHNMRRLCAIPVPFQVSQELSLSTSGANLDLSLVPDNKLLFEIDEVVKRYNALASHANKQSRLTAIPKREDAIAALASQVAHDVRSPLSALQVAMEGVDGLAEENRLLIRGAVHRIEDIANDLLKRRRLLRNSDSLSNNRSHAVWLAGALSSVVAEKRTQYRNRAGTTVGLKIESGAAAACAKLYAPDFKRVVSNLVNNAVESILDKGHASVVLADQGSTCLVSVEDEGGGMSEKTLSLLNSRDGFSTKAQGNGLGFKHAIEKVESWGGKVTIKSRIGEGTVVTMALPKCPAPAWLLSDLCLRAHEIVVVVDDDISIHRVWENRLATSYGREAIHHFSTLSDFKDFLQKAEERSRLKILIDYEFIGSPENGLDVIASTSLASQSILVTSRFEEEEIQQQCQSMGLKILPKPLASNLAFNISCDLKSETVHRERIA